MRRRRRAREQAEKIEKSGGTDATELNGMRVVVLTTVGDKSGNLRKSPLMRVEHEGTYALVASWAARRIDKSRCSYSNPRSDPRSREVRPLVA